MSGILFLTKTMPAGLRSRSTGQWPRPAYLKDLPLEWMDALFALINDMITIDYFSSSSV